MKPKELKIGNLAKESNISAMLLSIITGNEEDGNRKIFYIITDTPIKKVYMLVDYYRDLFEIPISLCKCDDRETEYITLEIENIRVFIFEIDHIDCKKLANDVNCFYSTDICMNITFVLYIHKANIILKENVYYLQNLLMPDIVLIYD